MTVPATARRAGPFIGNGVTTVFPFAFKLFNKADIEVTRIDADDEQTTLVLDSDYSVLLNVDQDAMPGGSITHPIVGVPLAVSETLSIVGNLPYDQVTDLPTGGAYRAQVVENTFDRVVMQIQQLAEVLDRTIVVSPGTDPDVNTVLPPPEPSNLIGWDEEGDALRNYPLTEIVSTLATASWRTDVFSVDGVQTVFELSVDPGNASNCDVHIDGVSQTAGLDFNVEGSTLTFVSPPPFGVDNVVVRHGQALPQAVDEQFRDDLANSDAGYLGAGMIGYDEVTDYPPGDTVGWKLNVISRTIPLNVYDFGARGNDNDTLLVDETAQFQAAIDAAVAQRRELYVPGTNYMAAGLIIPDAFTAMRLTGDPANRPIIHATQAAADAAIAIISNENTSILTVEVGADIIAGVQQITLVSTAGILPGMIIRIASSALWPYDNRGQWYKGELHLVTRVISATVIEIHGMVWDSYNIPGETLSAFIRTPRQLHMSNLHFKGKVPATDVSSILVQFRTLYHAEFDRLKVEVAGSSGINDGATWFSKYRNLETMSIGRASSYGYGMLVLSSTGLVVDGLVSRGCRRAVDFSSFSGTGSAPCRNCKITNFDVSGGGTQPWSGEGFYPAGAVPSYGVGGHGSMENIEISNGIIANCQYGISVRGLHMKISRVTFTGHMSLCIAASYGSGLQIHDCFVNYVDYVSKASDAGLSADVTAQPDYFLRLGDGGGVGDWNYSGITMVTNNKVMGCRLGFIYFNSLNNVVKLQVYGNSIYCRPGTPDTFSVYATAGPVNLYNCKTGPNFLNLLAGTGTYNYWGSGITVGYRSTTISAVEIGDRVWRSVLNDASAVQIRNVVIPGGSAVITLNSDDATVVGMFRLATANATLVTFGLIGSNVNGFATALSGGSGAAGKFSLHLAADGTLYLENRRGATLTVEVEVS